MHLSRRIGTALAIVVVLIAAGCSGSSGGAGGSVPTSRITSAGGTIVPAPGLSTDSAPPSAATSSAPAAAAGNLYVSIGDSYAAGYQPTSARSGRTTRNGFAYQLVTAAKAKGYALTLADFGCTGSTTTSALHTAGCQADYLGPGATPYNPKTQAAAAEDFLRAHQGQVALITVVLGGNDIVPCGAAANPTGCVVTAAAKLKANLHTLLTGLRAAAGPQTKIVGLTYPDVFLGNELSTNAKAKSLANLSVLAFRSLINPALQSSYAAVGGSFVDVTTATGAYLPMTQTTTLAPYGKIPVSVAKICELTYYCQYQDIHPRTNGYALIAKLVAAKLPTR